MYLNRFGNFRSGSDFQELLLIYNLPRGSKFLTICILLVLFTDPLGFFINCMIIPSPKHIFQTCFPQLELEEEEIFYPHPLWDLKVNQIGVIYPGESITYYSYSVLSENVGLNDLKTLKTTIPKQKLVAQCFAGSMDVPFQVVPLDGNPYNTTRDNLLYHNSQKKKALENYKTFKKNSIEYMLKRDVVIKSKGLFPGPYWALQKLPNYLRKPYEKQTGISLALDKYGFPKQTSWGEERPNQNRVRVRGGWKKDPRGRYRTTAEVNDLRKIAHELFDSGMTKAEIAKEMKELSTYVHYLLTSKFQETKKKD